VANGRLLPIIESGEQNRPRAPFPARAANPISPKSPSLAPYSDSDSNARHRTFRPAQSTLCTPHEKKTQHHRIKRQAGVFTPHNTPTTELERTMIKSLALSVGLALVMATPALAKGNWALDGEQSKVAFASVKKDTVGEVHHFSGLSGSVDESGMVTVDIDVASIETWIDIRNERIREFVLNGAPKVTLTAQIDTAKLEALAVGETTTTDVDGKLKLNGADYDIEASLFIARLTEDRMVAVTDEMIMLSTEDMGIDKGVDTLMKLADLPGITRVSPVTLRLVFNR
jgi:polyisoprenoid-binding protein YceI